MCRLLAISSQRTAQFGPDNKTHLVDYALACHSNDLGVIFQAHLCLSDVDVKLLVPAGDI